MQCLDLDVASERSIEAAVAALTDGDLAVDVLVNNAGFLHDGDLPISILANTVAVR